VGETKPTHKQNWSAYNEAQTNEKSKFQALLYELCQGIREPAQNFGRPRALIAEIIFAACVKVYGRLSGRRNQDYLWEPLFRGYLSTPIHYNTISKYLLTEELTFYLRQLITESSLPLKSLEYDFAIDSSGFATGSYKKWSEAKWGKKGDWYGKVGERSFDREMWVKIHIMSGVKTHIVTAVEVSNAHAGDSLFFEALVEQTSKNFVMNEISADKAYSSGKNLQLVLEKGAQPFIPFKSNTRIHRRSSSLWKDMYHYFMYNQKWFMEHYHKRSNVETTFSMIKAKFGERIKSKGERAQINEMLCKVLCHNICVIVQSIFELGLEPDFWPDGFDEQRILPF
jgi:transposase